MTVATLLLHGLTLPWLIRTLDVHDNTRQDDLLAEAQAQYDAARASIERLDELTSDADGTVAHNAEKLRRMAQMSANGVWEQLGRSAEENGESPNAAYRTAPRDAVAGTGHVRRTQGRGRHRRRGAAPRAAQARPRGGDARTDEAG